MFYRQDIQTTLPELRDLLAQRETVGEYLRVEPENIQFHFEATDPVIAFGETEIPASKEATQVMGDLLQVPSAFLNRAAESVSGTTLNALMTDLLRNNIRKDLAVKVGTGDVPYLSEVLEWGDQERAIKPVDVVDKIIPVFEGVDAKIARLVDERHFFGFDVYCPFEGEQFGVGGDFEVDDLTAAGVRTEINLKQGLAPQVQPFSYRRVCTNGMETPMAGLKIDGRGNTVEEVLAELESMARLAFARAESDIQHFYELRDQPVDNPERAIRAIARERGIPDRSTIAIIDLASGEDLPDEPTMFDVVNLITNFANSPQIRNDGGRLLLERAGGGVVTDHAARCSHCQQKVH